MVHSYSVKLKWIITRYWNREMDFSIFLRLISFIKVNLKMAEGVEKEKENG